MQREIYLDNSATTRPYDAVIDYINDINRETYGNASSLHTKGIEAEKIIKAARQKIADTMKVDSKEIIFTSGGTESNNLAILGYLEANPRKGKHIITSSIEHPSVLEVFKYLQGKGYKVDFINVNQEGIIQIEELRQKITKETALISIMLVNNEIGSIQPLEDIVRARNELNREAVLHVDAVQAYGKIAILPKKSGIEMLTVSSHKIHGPKGVGALYVDKNIRIKPVLHGGGQESLLRSGTENVPGIGGFGMSAEMIHISREESYQRMENLRNLFIDSLNKRLDRFTIISPEHALPYILNISFGDLRSEVLLHHLEEKGIFVSTGSACSSRKSIHSHVLKAIGIKSCDIEGAIRFSFSAFNTEQEIIDTVETMKEIVPKISVTRKGR
ncbi:MAG: cysteine desulfurase [Clostridia bacterium]|nr:cysteine desulfurase [Clostridia bacterium]